MNKKAGAAAAAAAPIPVAAVTQPQPSASPTLAPVAAPVTTVTSPAPAADVAEPTAMVVDEIQSAAAPSPVKKKKKKKNYKNMLSGMMEATGPRDAEKEKESIQKVTGGGAFVKIDKI